MTRQTFGRRGLLAAVATTAAGSAAAGGTAPETRLAGGKVYAIDATDGTVEWSVETGGTSRPVVANDTLYVAGQDAVHALDPSTGEHRWRTDRGIPISPLWHELRVAPTGIAVADGTLYATLAGGELTAIDATAGRTQWRHAHDGTLGTTPVVDGDTVYLSRSHASWGASGSEGGVRAVAAASGDARWTKALDEPLVVPPELDGANLLVGTRKRGPDATGRLHALDPTSGEHRWRTDAGAGVTGGLTVTPSGLGLAVVSVRTLRAFDPDTGETRWTLGVPTGSPSEASMPTYDGRLYVPGEAVSVVDPATGELLDSIGDGTAIDAPAVTDDRIYAPTWDHVTALDHGGTRRWAVDVRTEFETDRWRDDGRQVLSEKWDVYSPVVRDGTVYVSAARWQEYTYPVTTSVSTTPGFGTLLGAASLAGVISWLAGRRGSGETTD